MDKKPLLRQKPLKTFMERSLSYIYEASPGLSWRPSHKQSKWKARKYWRISLTPNRITVLWSIMPLCSSRRQLHEERRYDHPQGDQGRRWRSSDPTLAGGKRAQHNERQCSVLGLVWARWPSSNQSHGRACAWVLGPGSALQALHGRRKKGGQRAHGPSPTPLRGRLWLAGIRLALVLFMVLTSKFGRRGLNIFSSLVTNLDPFPSKRTYWGKLPNILRQVYRFLVLYCLPYKARRGHALETLVRWKSSMSTAIWWLPNRHEWLSKESWSRGGLFGLWPNMSPSSTYAKSFIKLPLDEADAGSLKLTN